MNVQEVAAAKALMILKAAGAQFHIRMGDGVEYGEPIMKQRKSKRTGGLVGPSLLHHYQGPIAAMNVGDVIQLPYPEGADRMRFKTNAQSYARSKFGADTCVVGSTDTHVEILRVQ
jgi:hypothetical protein